MNNTSKLTVTVTSIGQYGPKDDQGWLYLNKPLTKEMFEVGKSYLCDIAFSAKGARYVKSMTPIGNSAPAPQVPTVPGSAPSVTSKPVETEDRHSAGMRHGNALSNACLIVSNMVPLLKPEEVKAKIEEYYHFHTELLKGD